MLLCFLMFHTDLLKKKPVTSNCVSLRNVLYCVVCSVQTVPCAHSTFCSSNAKLFLVCTNPTDHPINRMFVWV